MNVSDEKTEEELLSEKLTFNLKNCWETASQEERVNIAAFAEGYKEFLNEGKTEQLCFKKCVEILTQKGFTVDFTPLGAHS